MDGYKRIRGVLYDFYRGLVNEYPICCVVRYCWDRLLGRKPCAYRDRKTKVVKFDDCSGDWLVKYVPCLWFHKWEYVVEERGN